MGEHKNINSHRPSPATRVDRAVAPETAPATTLAARVPEVEIIGGDLFGCLSDVDIDRYAAPALGPHYIAARAYYDARTAITSFPALRERIVCALDDLRKINAPTWVVLPVHTRHHWATALIEQCDSRTLSATVFDSALSRATARDWVKGFRALEIPCAVTVHARQPRDSNDCGLHVLLLAAAWGECLARGRWPSHPPPSSEVLSLQAWRPLLEAGSWGITALVAVVPQAARLVGTPDDAIASSDRDVAFASSDLPACSAAGDSPELGPASRGDVGWRWDVPIHRQPLLGNTRPQPSSPVVDVDNDDGLQVTWAELGAFAPAIGISSDVLDGLRAEFVARHEERREENARRRQGLTPGQLLFKNTALPLWRFPEGLRQQLALRLQERVRQNLGPEHWHEIFCAKEAGTMLSSSVIDEALDALREAAERVRAHVVLCESLTMHANIGPAAARRPGECVVPAPTQGTNHVLSVMHTEHPRHYVAVWVDVTEARIGIFDSLFGSTPPPAPSREIVLRLGRLKALLCEWGFSEPTRVEVLACALQAPNDCGLEALSNVVRVIRSLGGHPARDHAISRATIAVGWERGMQAFKGEVARIAGEHDGPAVPPQKGGLSRDEIVKRLSTIPPGTRAQVHFCDGSQREVKIFERRGRGTEARWQVVWDFGDSFSEALLPDVPYAGDIVEIVTPEPKRRTHDPYARALSPPPAVAPSHQAPLATCALPGDEAAGRPETQRPAPLPPPFAPLHATCCSREALAQGLCAWHHPRMMRSFGRCGARNSRGARCGEQCLAVVSASGDRCAWSCATCWYHASPRERAEAIRFLQDPCAEKEQAPAASAAQGVALSHVTVRAIMSVYPTGRVVELDCSTQELFAVRRCRVLARVVRPAVRTRAGEVDVIARRCDVCLAWHAVDVPRQPIPAVDTSYFSIKAVTEVDVQAAEMSPDCVDVEIGSDVDEDGDVGGPGTPVDTQRFLDDVEREPLWDNGGQLAPSALRTDAARSWHVHRGRPPHVARLAWASVSAGTRAEHIRWLLRLKDAPPECARWPLARTALELVTRCASEKGWRWSTLAAKLSAVRSAVRNLPLHSACTRGFDIGVDPVFAAAQIRAQKHARVESIHPLRSRPLSFDEFRALAASLAGRPRLLLILSWWMASRVGDTRRLCPENVSVDVDDVDGRGFVPVRALFTEGKGAHFWGPFAVHARIPLAEGKMIAEMVHSAVAEHQHTLCAISDQSILSRAVGELPDASLRSIRKGSLHWFADAGADDTCLQLLSQHRQRDTLLRYLGWGLVSSEAERAAGKRAQLVADIVRGAGHPMWMGEWSGFNGDAGRRVRSPPRLFPRRTPTRAELGIEEGRPEDWPLHVKPEICPLPVEAACGHVVNDDLRAALQQGLNFLRCPELYGVSWAALAPAQLPRTSFTADHWRAMFAGRKCVPFRVVGSSLVPIREDGSVAPAIEIRSACRGFPTPQASKHRLRPVFEPLHNGSVRRDLFPPLSYPHRRARRAAVAAARYVAEFDFAAWYDQAALGEASTAFHVCRSVPTAVSVAPGRPVEDVEYWGLTRCPMGASFSAHVMQTLTWAIAEPLLDPAGPFAHGRLQVYTMIDNVLLISDEPDVFAAAVELFRQRCRLFGAQLNDEGLLPSNPEDIVAYGDTKNREFTFLGEVFSSGRVCNSERNVAKLREAWERLQNALTDPNTAITRRQVAALLGLAMWMANTLEMPVCEYFAVLRLFARLEAQHGKWDERVQVEPRMVNEIGTLVGPLLTNAPVAPAGCPGVPEQSNSAYDAVIITDASASGLGAIVQFPASGEVYECRKGWGVHIAHSAWAEPIAATEAVRWARAKGARSVAVVSDHAALAFSQRRPDSGNGGFSKAYHLNAFFRELYSVPGRQAVFYVEGEDNPADAPSRATFVGDTAWRVRRRTDAFPSLASFYYPFSEPPSRPWWNA